MRFLELVCCPRFKRIVDDERRCSGNQRGCQVVSTTRTDRLPAVGASWSVLAATQSFPPPSFLAFALTSSFRSAVRSQDGEIGAKTLDRRLTHGLLQGYPRGRVLGLAHPKRSQGQLGNSFKFQLDVKRTRK